VTILGVDASVACKWYLDEELSAEARALADSDALFVAPDLLLVDAGNVLWRRLRAGEIDAPQAEEAAKHLPRMFLAIISARELLGRALAIARALDHAVHDCFYLAAAERWDVALLTADDQLLRKLTSTGLAVPAIHLRDYSLPKAPA
jgi:predicted nucleic acid-binding protein